MVTDKIVPALKRYLLRGFVVLVPAIFTILLLSVAFGFVSNAIQPLTDSLTSLLNIQNVPSFIVDVIALLALVVLMIIMGFVSALIPTAREVTDVFHAIVESIPGIGSVYSSFRKMSVTMIQGQNSFRDVKLAEYPSDNCYTIAFVTAKDNGPVSEAVGEKTTTLFIPMAPNPFMGGFVANMPEDKVHEVDMTVREGIKSVITSGVTLSVDEDSDTVTLDKELEELENAIQD